MSKKSVDRRQFVTSLATGALAAPLAAGPFSSAWPDAVEMPWLGPDYWSNPLQEWRLRKGRIECLVAGGDRNVFLLTREIGAQPGNLETSVELGRLEGGETAATEEGSLEGFVGFRVGIRGHFDEYRDSAVRGEGLNAGVTHDGRLFIGRVDPKAPSIGGNLDKVRLRLTAVPAGSQYRVQLEATTGGKTVRHERRDIPADALPGGIALVCHSGKIRETPAPLSPMAPNGGVKPGTQRGGALRFWFQDWNVQGSKVTDHPDRAFGPILFAMHTLSRRTLKLTAQMAPVAQDGGQVYLEVQRPGASGWTQAAASPIDPLSRTAHFRIENWDDTADVPYRLRYTLKMPPAPPREVEFTGTIRKDPKDKAKLVIAALTCNNDFGFPHRDIARNVAHFQPDLLLFTGDQIYERVAEYGIQMAPLEPACLDYLRKWYLFGWAFRDLLRDTPSVAMPDDHDMYHGNIWGAGGVKAVPPDMQAPKDSPSYVAPPNRTKAWQDSGGYKMPPEWVNAVQRTQTSHLPDPFDPTPVAQGITVYYTSLLYGGLSLAIVEDRKWKSPPHKMIPWADISNGWAQNPAYHAARDGDVPGAELLGPRQIRFLEEWAKDWTGGAFVKAVVSQTIFANVCTLPPPADNDDVTPGLPTLKPAEFAEGEVLVADHDSNGWPQTPRNQALYAMRKAQAFHIGGDQHLGSTVQYGIETHQDAAFAICTPAISNLWPRRWYPPKAGANGTDRYSGDFIDGFGNRVTVHAVSNPATRGAEPSILYNRAPGYGIVEIDRASRKITLANWPRWVDPGAAGAGPYDGWPIRIHPLDNGLAAAKFALPDVDTQGTPPPVVQVIDQSSGEIVYTVRAQEAKFTPKVWREGVYSVRVFDPDQGGVKEVRDQRTKPA